MGLISKQLFVYRFEEKFVYFFLEDRILYKKN